MIYGIAGNSSTCELIFPKQDTVGITHFVNQSIVGNDIPESIVGNHCYAIRFVGEYTVFSKIHIVYDCYKRRGYRAFMIVLNKVEAKKKPINVLEKILELEDKYKRNIKQKSKTPEIIEIGNINTKNETIPITTYYNDETALKDFFEYNKNYKEKYETIYEKYETIYFIDETLKDTPKNPYKALQNPGKVVPIEDIIKLVNITENEPPVTKPETDLQPDTKNEKWKKWKLVIIKWKRVKIKWKLVIIISSIVLILGFILAMLLIFGNFNLFIGKKAVESSIVDEKPDETILPKDTAALNEVIETQDTTTSPAPVPVLEETEDPKEHTTAASPKSTEGGTSGAGNSISQEEIENFMKEDCKAMTIPKILDRIDKCLQYANGLNSARLNYFKEFIEIINADSLDLNKLVKFCNNKEDKLNNEFLYVIFYNNLKEKALNDDCTTKRIYQPPTIDDIENKTFQEIKLEYEK